MFIPHLPRLRNHLLMLCQKEKVVSVRWIKKLIEPSFLIKNGTEI